MVGVLGLLYSLLYWAFIVAAYTAIVLVPAVYIYDVYAHKFLSLGDAWMRHGVLRRSRLLDHVSRWTLLLVTTLQPVICMLVYLACGLPLLYVLQVTGGAHIIQ